MIEIIFTIVAIILIFIIILCIYIYPKLILSLTKDKKLQKNKKILPVTVIIPTYNEEKYIERKIKDLLKSNYPLNKLTILIVDNGSKDKTKEIVKKIIKKRRRIRLIESERGKINAINKGIENSNTDLVAVTDADSTISKDCIKNTIAHINNNVKAVSAFTVLKPKKLFFMKDKIKYIKKDSMLRYKESILDSVCNLDGKFMLFSKDIIKKLPDNSYADDYELSLLLRKRRYRVIVTKDSLTYEETPASFIEEVNQIRRRMSFIILTNWKYRLLFNPKYSYFGMFILPCRRFFPLFFPFFFFFLIIYFFYIFIYLGIFILLFSIIYSIAIDSYQPIQLLGVGLSWFDILTGRVKKGAVWKKIKTD